MTSINPTPIVLSYFAEKGHATRQEITSAVFQVSSLLKAKNIQVDAVFRGSLQLRDRNIQSETIDDELGFWVSNNLIRSCSSHAGDDICFEVKEMGSNSIQAYSLKNLSGTLDLMQWHTGINRSDFVGILNEVIGSE